MNERQRAMLSTALTVLAIVAVFTGLTWWANTHEWLTHPSQQRMATRTALTLLVFVSVVTAALLPLLIWVTYLDRTNGGLSPLMLPMLLFDSCFTVLVGFGALAALDRLRHGLTLRWNLTNEPELLIPANLLYLGIFLGRAGFLAVTMRRRGWSRPATAGMLGLMLLAGVLVVAVVLVL